MKKSMNIFIIITQVLMLLVILGSARLSVLNSESIAYNKSLLQETRNGLNSTFTIMDQLAEAEKAALPLQKGTQAPAFSLYNQNKKEVSLDDFKGKKTLLVFSQPGCNYCKDFYPILNAFNTKKDDINIVIMQLNSNPEDNKKDKKKYGIEVPILAATNTELVNYKISATPTSVLLDENGQVIHTDSPRTLETLENFVEG